MGGGCLRSITEEEFRLMGIELTRPGQFVQTGKGLDECVLLVMVWRGIKNYNETRWQVLAAVPGRSPGSLPELHSNIATDNKVSTDRLTDCLDSCQIAKLSHLKSCYSILKSSYPKGFISQSEYPVSRQL